MVWIGIMCSVLGEFVIENFGGPYLSVNRGKENCTMSNPKVGTNNRDASFKCSAFARLCLLLLFMAGACLSGWAGGTVTVPTQANFEAALAGGGTVVFECNGTVTLTNTITISQDTLIDGNGHDVVISGGNVVRLFQVGSNVSFSAKSLALANGLVMGANGADGHPAQSGQDGLGAGILSLGGIVNLTDCSITNHQVSGGNGGLDPGGTNPNPAKGANGIGAAIYLKGGALRLTNCEVAANWAKGGNGGDTSFSFGATGDAGIGFGGAIY